VMRDSVLPIVDASRRFGGPARTDAEYAVVVRGATGSLALSVTTLVGQRELVTRPLPPEVAENSALSGAAVMSDGQIALIVDCDAVETASTALVTA
jgi:two-component system, chemotaxis family, sensor kinase CheA